MGVRTNTTAGITYPVGSLEALLSGSSAVTVAYWLKETSFSGATFADARTQIILYVNAFYDPGIQIGGVSGNLTVYAQSQGADAIQTLTSAITVDRFVGSFSHVAVVVDFENDTISLFVDGEPAGSTAATFGATAFTPSGVSRNARIGAATPTAGTANATLAELGIWGRGLSPMEISQLASGLHPPLIEAGLRSYMPLGGDTTDDHDLISGTIATRAGAVVNDDHPFIHYGDDEQYLYWSAGGSSAKPWLYAKPTSVVYGYGMVGAA
jgi:hypothetical protein